MALFLQMIPFKDYTTVWLCLFSLPITLVILLGLRLRFPTSFFADVSLAMINILQYCIGVGKLVIHKIWDRSLVMINIWQYYIGVGKLVIHKIWDRSLVMINIWQYCNGVGKRVIHNIWGTKSKAQKMSSEIQDLASEDVRHKGATAVESIPGVCCIPCSILEEDSQQHWFKQPCSILEEDSQQHWFKQPCSILEEDSQQHWFMQPCSILEEDSQQHWFKQPCSILEEDSQQHWFKQPCSILEEDSQQHWFKNVKMMEARGEILSCITEDDAVPRASKEGPAYILEEDAQQHSVKHVKMMEAPGGILSCISEKDALPRARKEPPAYILEKDAQRHSVKRRRKKKAQGNIPSYILEDYIYIPKEDALPRASKEAPTYILEKDAQRHSVKRRGKKKAQGKIPSCNLNDYIYTPKEDALPRASKEAPRYILNKDAQRHRMKHVKMKEAPGEIPSCISKEDARRHQVDHEEIKSAHGLKGMDSYVIQVLHFLQCTSLSVLGITGMHGVGKTTLLRLVHNFLAERSSLDYVFLLGLGTGCTVGNLQRSILAKILGPQHQISDTRTAAKIISSSLKDKRFLFLFDDLQEPLDLVAIGLPMPLGCQQKVIFTTPDEAMCDEIGCVGNTINIHPLGEEDAWSLFMTGVQDEYVEEHLAFKELAERIVHQCQGLPVALAAIGRAMSVRKDIDEWEHVCHLFEVKHPLFNEIRDLPYPSSWKHIYRLLRS